MKIYTSYFANIKNVENEGIEPISIALWNPRWYRGKSYRQLNPKREMLSKDMSENEYIVRYERILSELAPEKVLSDLGFLSGGKDCALICYEKPSDFCHRQLVAKWLNEKLGTGVVEFDHINFLKMSEEEKVSKNNQQTLF